MVTPEHISAGKEGKECLDQVFGAERPHVRSVGEPCEKELSGAFRNDEGQLDMGKFVMGRYILDINRA